MFHFNFSRMDLFRFAMSGLMILTLVTGISIVAVSAHSQVDTSNNGETDASARPARLRGRDFVELGEISTLTGTLKFQRGEWFLISGNKTYELHFGNHDHRKATGIQLETGKTATATGFLYGLDMAVCSVYMDGQKYEFRTEEGTPLWAGSSGGEGSGQEGGRGTGRGLGAGQSDGAGQGSGAGAGQSGSADQADGGAEE